MASSVFTESPVLLLSYQESNREFRLSEEGKNILKNLESPVSIVGVAGMYRTGKSYLLNRVLLNRKFGFGVGPTVNPCTKGIWIWGSPIKGRTLDGSPCSVIILDTEGIGALDQDSDHDSRIFSLTVLIVSCFIYNSRGSIDEEALTNLSLVVNLTKHIQIKSKSSEEVGVEEYAQYFPSFMWVVRDFALKLVDTDGESLTSKEYLEKALNAQKGFSDLAEEKNRIRRLLKEFFKDRDCCTLVRPVNNEKDLHNLENLEANELRPEFLEQVENLRNRVLNNVKPKMLNNRALNGDMLVELIESYVNAVNKGAVPNIENAWNYICKNECSKAFEDSQELYNKKIAELLTDNYPNFEDELLMIHKEARKCSFTYFKSKALGEESQRIYVKLKETLQEKWQQLRFQNDTDSEKQCLEFLKNNYSTINNKLKSTEYKSFLDFEREIRTLQQYFKEHGPKGPQRDKLLYQFSQNKLIEAADIFMKHLNSEIEIMESTHAEKLRVLEMDANIVNEEIVREKTELKKIVAAVETEKKELLAKDDALLNQYNSLKEEKEKVETELKGLVKKVKDESQKEVERLSKELGDSEDARKSLNNSVMQKNSELKEKTALFEQKMSHLEKANEEMKQKEKELEQEIRNLAKVHSGNLKEIQTKFEEKIKQLENQVKEETEEKFSIEKELEEVQDELYRLKSSFDNEVNQHKTRLEDSIAQNRTLTQTLDKKEKEFLIKLKEVEKNSEEIVARGKKVLEETEKKAKKNEDGLKSEISTLDKENAVLNQKIEFLELQVNELKFQLDEERKQHALMIASFSGITDNSKNLELELEALKEKHANELKYIESQNESTKSQLLVDIEKLTQSKTDTELRYKLDSSEWIQKHENLTEDINTLSTEKEKLKEQITDLKKQLEALSQEIESRYKGRVLALEKQLDETREKLLSEIQQEKKNAENSFAQLKESYESEKKRLESRIFEEKEKAEKRFKAMVEEYEEKIRTDCENFEEELASKDQDMREFELIMNEEVNGLKNQVSLDFQKIETLEQYVKDLKAQFESQERAYNNMIEQSQVRFNQERTMMQDKLDKLTSEISVKERDNAMLGYQKQQLDSQITSKTDELKELKLEFEKLKENSQKKNEDLKTANKTLTEELISLKSDYKRELALVGQECEFKSLRITEIEKALKETEEKYRETLKILKSEGQDSSSYEKLASDKEILFKKLQEKKKTMKQLQSGFTRQITELEKEKVGMNEKIMNLERTLADIEFKSALDQDRLRVEDNLFDIESTIANDEVDRLKSQIQDLEQDLTSTKTLFEREKLLWENKFKFLSEQKDLAKSDLAEAQRKFEFTLQQLQKREQSGKEKQEGTLNSLVSSIESRYNTKLKDLQEFSNSTIEHLNLKIKLLEQEIKGLKEELEIARRGKNLLSGSIDKRCKQLQEIETKLMNEIENLKLEKERKSKEILDLSGIEKDQMRGKLNEMERKVKDAENAKNQMYLELEKERSKWQMERDHLFGAKNDALEAFENLQNKQEMLLRENERLKGDKYKNRNMPSRRVEHHKALSSQAAGSPSKLQEFYSHRVEMDSARNDSQSSYRRKNSFSEA